MVSRDRIRLGAVGHPSGELAPPEDGETAGRQQARWIFCEVLEDEAPEVLQELHDEVCSDENARIDALGDWGKRYRLDDPWLMDVARRSVRSWNRVPEAIKQDPEHPWSPRLNRFGLLSDGSFPDVPEHPGPWFPGSETKVEYIERVKQYINEVEAAYREAGWTDAKEKRSPAAQDPTGAAGPTTHFRWVVRLHVHDQTVAEVCEAAGFPSEEGSSYPRAVRKAYSEMCHLLGLTPRSQRSTAG